MIRKQRKIFCKVFLLHTWGGGQAQVWERVRGISWYLFQSVGRTRQKNPIALKAVFSFPSIPPISLLCHVGSHLKHMRGNTDKARNLRRGRGQRSLELPTSVLESQGDSKVPPEIKLCWGICLKVIFSLQRRNQTNKWTNKQKKQTEGERAGEVGDGWKD